MRLHRIFIEQNLRPGQNLTLAGEEAHYLSRVLRAVVGQPVVLFNGDGFDYTAEICAFKRDAVVFSVKTSLSATTESPLDITLVQAISRGERMDLSLQKATELGVTAVQPVFSARTEVRLRPEKLDRRMAHWRKVIIAACEQCGRARLPLLHEPLDMLLWMQRESGRRRFVLVPGAAASLASVSAGAQMDIVVGPEGGFDEAEIAALQRHSVQPVSLGPRILRTESAGPAALAVLQALAGDLK